MLEKLLMIAPLVLFAILQTGVGAQRSYNSYPRSNYGRYFSNSYEHGRFISDNTVSCGSFTCGVGAHCVQGSVRQVCACLAGYSGDPFSQCVKIECLRSSECRSHQTCVNQHCVNRCEGTCSSCNCGVNADCETVSDHSFICKCPRGYHGDPYKSCSDECTSDGECPSYRPVCVNNVCINPCPEACGVNADCNLRGLTAVCSCPKTHIGDPYSHCRLFDALDLCAPNPCGANAECFPGHDRTGAERPVCKCPSGYIGNPLESCDKGGCELDSQCSDHLACVDSQCVDPCFGNTQCGFGAVCMARRHLSICTCPPGYSGDAFLNCYESRSVIATALSYNRYKRHGGGTNDTNIEAPSAPIESASEATGKLTV